MSVIAWDGKTIAADKRATNDGLIATTTKLFNLDDFDNPHGYKGYVGFVGSASQGMALIHWLLKGAKPSKYPAFQATDNWTRLIYVDTASTRPVVRMYESTPHPMTTEDKYMAWGSGRDYALTAMYLGKTAEQAVEVAVQLNADCGNGVTKFDTK